MRFPLVATTVVFSILLTFMRSARADEQSELEKARNAYLAKQYEEADERFRQMLDPKSGSLHDPALVTQARMIWGAVLLAQGKPVEASALFEKLLMEDAHFEPDPLSFPTEVVNAFIDTRAKIRDRLHAAAQATAQREADRRAKEEQDQRREAARVALLERLASSEKVIETHSRWLALIPFGVGQFQNSQKALGWLFLASETVWLLSAGVTVPIYSSQLSLAEEAHVANDDFRAQAYLDRAKVTRAVNLASFAAFAATAIIGVVHAQLTYLPDHVEVRKRTILPITAKGLPSVIPIASLGGGWQQTAPLRV